MSILDLKVGWGQHTSQEKSRAIVGVAVQELDTLRDTVLEVVFTMMQRAIQWFPATDVNKPRKRIHAVHQYVPSFGLSWRSNGHWVIGSNANTVVSPQGGQMHHLLPFLRNLGNSLLGKSWKTFNRVPTDSTPTSSATDKCLKILNTRSGAR